MINIEVKEYTYLTGQTTTIQLNNN